MISFKGTVLLTVILLVFIGGYYFVTQGGDYSEVKEIRPDNYSANVRAFTLDHNNFEIYYEAADGKNYSTEGRDGAFPIEGFRIVEKTVIDDLILSKNDGYFSGDYFDEGSKVIEKRDGVMNGGIIYLSEEAIDCDKGRFPYVADCHESNNTVISEFRPGKILYVIMFCAGLFLILCLYVGCLELRKKK